MAIIISEKGKNTIKLDKASIPHEDFLQRQIYENPECIPLYDYKEDVQLLILAREFSVGSGSIDALGIDEDGEVYLIETKLYKNPDKRLVVAQVLDYGASLWQSYPNFADFIKKVDEIVHEKSKLSINDRIKDFFELDDDELAELLENLEKNVHEARFKFVVLMDKLHERLKDLITFINENSNFAIFAVEVEYYMREDQEIFIPKLFGAEIKGTTRSSSSRSKWGEEKFLETARGELGQSQAYIILEKLYIFSKSNADKVGWGSGTTGSFTFKIENPKGESAYISMFTIWIGGRIEFRFASVEFQAGVEAAELFQKKISFLPVSKKWTQKGSGHHGPTKTFSLQDAFPDDDTLNRFMSSVLDFKNEIKMVVK